jgi:hypothetical protein
MSGVTLVSRRDLLIAGSMIGQTGDEIIVV